MSTKENPEIIFPPKCFIIMPFREEFNDLYHHLIVPLLRENELDHLRMDEALGSINLIEKMIHNIFEAELIIAVLTGNSANVFYELGIAHTLTPSKKVIMIVEESEDIPFDIAPYNVIKYKLTIEGTDILRKDLQQEIDQFFNHQHEAANPVQDYLNSSSYENRQSTPVMVEGRSINRSVLENIQYALSWNAILECLNKLPARQPGLDIGDIHKQTPIKSRKYVAIAIQEMKKHNIVESVVENGKTLHRLSVAGNKLAKEVAVVIRK